MRKQSVNYTPWILPRSARASAQKKQIDDGFLPCVTVGILNKSKDIRQERTCERSSTTASFCSKMVGLITVSGRHCVRGRGSVLDRIQRLNKWLCSNWSLNAHLVEETLVGTRGWLVGWLQRKVKEAIKTECYIRYARNLWRGESVCRETLLTNKLKLKRTCSARW